LEGKGKKYGEKTELRKKTMVVTTNDGIEKEEVD